MATWKQIKEALASKGVTDQDEIAYIDMGFIPVEIEIKGEKKALNPIDFIRINKNEDGQTEITG